MNQVLYFLYGQDQYRLRQKLRDIEQEYSQKFGNILDILRLDLQENDPKTFWDCLGQSSLFEQIKFLIVENSFCQPVFKKDFLKKIKSLVSQNPVLIFIEPKEIKATDPFLLVVKENGKVLEFAPLTPSQLSKWAEKTFNSLGASIDSLALQKLLQYAGGDMWRLANEIKKLAAFKKNISQKDVELLIIPQFKVEIFKTIDAFASKNKKMALTELQKHLDLGEKPVYLLSMLPYQARNLLLVKLAQEKGQAKSADLGMHPFVFSKAAGFAKKFSLEQLKKVFFDIFQAELKLKTGQISPAGSLKYLVAAI